jgi:hypothetical protein
MNQELDNAQFARVVEALRPWLPEVVIAGGWAHRLHRLHELADPPAFTSLMTEDVDVALRSSLPDGADLRTRLLAEQFTEEITGDDRPPITHYRIGTPRQPFYVDFLTPLVGSENKRDGRPDVTTRVGGVVAQKLRHLDVLLLGPWLVAIGPTNGFPLETQATVRVPNPAAYMAQKLLILPRRKREDQERDVLYVHDTLHTFARHLPEAREAWLVEVAPSLHPRRIKELTRGIRDQFSDLTDIVRGAADIAASVGRPISSRSLLEACRFGLERIFL